MEALIDYILTVLFVLCCREYIFLHTFVCLFIRLFVCLMWTELSRKAKRAKSDALCDQTTSLFREAVNVSF